MAKKSVIMRNRKRQRISERMKVERSALRKIAKSGGEGAEEASMKMQKRRRDESPSRVRERCRFCGRGHGTLKKFGLCRIHLREATMRGDVPGLRKASW